MATSTLIIFFIVLLHLSLNDAERGCPFRSSECKLHCLETEKCNNSRCGGWLWQVCQCVQCEDENHENQSIGSSTPTSQETNSTTESVSVSTVGDSGSEIGTTRVTETTTAGVEEDDTNKVGSDDVPHEDIITEPL